MIFPENKKAIALPVAILFSASIFALSVTNFAFSHAGAKGIVKERMDVMKDIGSQMKTMGLMARGKQAFDEKLIAKSASVIGEHAKTLNKLFPEDSTSEHSEARPIIWQDFDDFLAKAKAMENAGMAMASQASGGMAKPEFMAAFGKLAGTCKGCHTTYRQKK